MRENETEVQWRPTTRVEVEPGDGRRALEAKLAEGWQPIPMEEEKLADKDYSGWIHLMKLK
jgi:hypothetical protein